MFPTIVSVLAPVVSSVQLFPQLYKTFVSKSVHDLSSFSLLLILITNVLWLLHGVIIKDRALVVAGIFSIIVNISLLALVLFYSGDQLTLLPRF
jgi:uncharacterized protein with PQ loop repeat